MMSMTCTRSTDFLCLVFSLLLLSGCAGHMSRQNSSSVVDYLYPDKQGYIETASIPRLSLPMSIAIAFVPGNSRYDQAFTEQEKIHLLDQISSHLKQQAYVRSIDILPGIYLRPGGGFENLDQIRTLHGVDVIVLVSYDQTQFTDEGFASIAYWTLIGAYIIPGEKNDTHTMVDAVVYDIESRKMLFRAPGISHIKGLATPVNLSEKLHEDSMQGFALASEDLVKNLDHQLALFKDKVKNSPKEYQVVHRAGYTGGGSLDFASISVLSLVTLYLIFVRGRVS